MNRDDVIDVLTAVSAADRRTVGQADVDVWQAVIGDLPKDLAFQAVRDHLREKPGVWLEPGHIYECPWRKAGHGSRCVIPGTRVQLTEKPPLQTGFHPERIKAAEKARANAGEITCA